MTEVDALTKIATTLAGPAGTFFVIALIGFGLATKRIVPGWVYEQCMDDAKALSSDLATRVAKSEAELEQMRRDRMGKRD